MKYIVHKLLFVYLLLYSLEACSQAREFDIRERSIYLPVPQQNGKFDHSVSLAQIYLPYEWLEQAISGPMICYKANYALPKGFSLNGNIKTLLIANDIRLGLSWNHSLNDQLHFGIGYQFGFEFGILRTLGYNNTIRVWEHHPMARIGFNVKSIAFTLQGEMDWMMGTKLVLDDYATNNITGSLFNGYAVGLFIEQRVTKRNSICFGFIANYNKFHILGWPALMIVDQRYFIPEINIGFKL